MGISFCKGCKNILPPTNSDQDFIECRNCGLKHKNKRNLISSEKIKRHPKKGEGAKSEENIYASYKHLCRKCGYEKAQIIDMGIKYSDEDNLIFLKCGKCGFSERIGRKVS
ncbi:MAG: hypothetical protein Q8Q04_00590 [archaeon]|nr:hypothetical protein [archaeon]